MSPGRPARSLSLSSRELNILRSHVGRRTLSRGQHQRISIIIDVAEGKSVSAISRRFDIARLTVRKWRDRFHAGLPELRAFEEGPDGKGVSDRELLDRMLDLLSDCPRSGKPVEISPSEVQQIVAIACRKPSDFGHPRSDWTHQLIAQIAIEQGIVKHLSGRYVGELLKKTAPASPQK